MFGIRPLAESFLRQEENPFDSGGSGGGASPVPPEVWQRYLDGSATDQDLQALLSANEITLGQAQEYRAQRDPTAGLTQDLRDLGLMPLDDYMDEPERDYRQGQARQVGRDPSTALTPEQFERNVYGSTDPVMVDRYGELYDRSGDPLTEARRRRILGAVTGSGSSDPYAAEENARANTRLAEQIRAQRISEAMDAIEMRRQAINAAQQARLEGAGFSLPAGTTHFPGLTPTSPLVRSGLADPFRVNPVAFDPSLVLDTGNQWEKDLAMIRSGAMR